MDLLVFAHRGEANAFLNHGSFELIKNNLWRGYLLDHGENKKKLYLLVCGEGIHQSMSQTSLALGSLDSSISQVINYGVCGALRKDLTVGEIHPIKICYGEDEFHSFPLAKDGVDLISSKKRVLTAKQHDSLDNFAPLVDREAWAIAYSCKQMKIDLKAFKLISDYADGNEICAQVKDQAIVWSEKMLRHYLHLGADSMEKSERKANLLELPIDRSLFHITISQERQLQKLFHALKLKGASLEIETVNKISSQDLRPKERTKKLIQYLTQLLNPLKVKQEQVLNELSENLRRVGANINFSKDLENPQFSLTVNIQGEKEGMRVAEALERFDFQKLNDFVEGKGIDV